MGRVGFWTFKKIYIGCSGYKTGLLSFETNPKDFINQSQSQNSDF